MEKVIHKSSSRGYANHGWLQAKHSFSFASWYDPERVHFGALRVLNDDQIAPAMGFPTHPHDNMEIITIPLEGGVKHHDNMGNEGVILPGELQIMSAGSGVTHSEFNASEDQFLRLFQVWIIPNAQNVKPRYQQITLADYNDRNQVNLLVGPENGPVEAWIHQSAFISILHADTDCQTFYHIHDENNGVYILVVEGSINVENDNLADRDAIGIWDADRVELTSLTDSTVLFFEVPMNF